MMFNIEAVKFAKKYRIATLFRCRFFVVVTEAWPNCYCSARRLADTDSFCEWYDSFVPFEAMGFLLCGAASDRGGRHS